MRNDSEGCRREIEQRQSELEAIALDVALGQKGSRTLRAKEMCIRGLEARITHLGLAIVEAVRRRRSTEPQTEPDAHDAGSTSRTEQSNSTGEPKNGIINIRP